jgi:hypothetical protein
MKILIIFFSLLIIGVAFTEYPIKAKELFIEKLITDTNLIKFTGQVKKVKYSNNRRIREAPFKIVNKTGNNLKVKLIRVTLLRGDSEDELSNGQFQIFLSGRTLKCSDYNLKPNATAEFNVIFKSYTIYAGSSYAVKAYITINGEKYESISNLEIYRLEIGDINKYKD